MNLYLITQDVNLSPSAYRAAVVAALSYTSAQHTHPGGEFFNTNDWWEGEHHSGRPEIDRSGFWVQPEHVKVELIGSDNFAADPLPAGVVCARTAETNECVETFAKTEGRRCDRDLDGNQPNASELLP